MNCDKCKELLAQYIEGLLEQSQLEQVSEHLKNCPGCQAEHQQQKELQERLVKNGAAISHSNLEGKVMDAIVRQQHQKLKAVKRAGNALGIRSIIMKSPMVKFTAAAVIIIAAILLFNPFSGTITIAKVVEPIFNSRIIAFDLYYGSQAEEAAMRDIIIGTKIRREMPNMAMTMIIDVDNSNALALFEQDKTAAYMKIEGGLNEMFQDYFKFIQDMISNNRDKFKNLGQQKIDGQKAIKFEAGGHHDHVVIWADPETALPIQIELNLGQIAGIYKHFEFDPPYDDSLVSMDVPPGYTLDEKEMSFGDSTEQYFIEYLRIWAEIISDGVFPESIGSDKVMTIMPVLVEKLGKGNFSEEQATEIGTKFADGMLFLQQLEMQNNAQYIGDGIKFGDADKPVFWYKQEDSDMYRVIYGDLHIKEAAFEDIPK